MFHAPKGSYTIFNYLTKFTQNKYTRPYIILHVVPTFFGPGIRGTQVKSSTDKNWMSPSRNSDGANFSETPPSWHVRSIFSFINIVNY